MSRTCEHGGVPVGSSLGVLACLCDLHYTGEHCETLVCDNYGTLVWDTRNMQQICICNVPRISGFYCDKLACSHDGVDNGDGACDCLMWHSGRFCESYATWFLAATFVCLLLIAVVVALLVTRHAVMTRRGIRECKAARRESRAMRQAEHGALDCTPPLADLSQV